MRSNRPVDSGTLRQGAAQCCWKSCTVRPLAATCRSPSRYSGAFRPFLLRGSSGDQVPRLVLAASAVPSSALRPPRTPRTAAGLTPQTA
jgi:hypothetical protein